MFGECLIKNGRDSRAERLAVLLCFRVYELEEGGIPKILPKHISHQSWQILLYGTLSMKTTFLNHEKQDLWHSCVNSGGHSQESM